MRNRQAMLQIKQSTQGFLQQGLQSNLPKEVRTKQAMLQNEQSTQGLLQKGLSKEMQEKQAVL